MALCVHYFLQAYGVLNEWAASNDTWLFHVVMKHHMMLHLAIGSKFLNPRSHTCFRAESFAGSIASLGHSVSIGVRSARLSLKVMPEYRILLHFLLTREGFEVAEQHLD